MLSLLALVDRYSIQGFVHLEKIKYCNSNRNMGALEENNKALTNRSKYQNNIIKHRESFANPCSIREKHVYRICGKYNKEAAWHSSRNKK